MSPNSENPRTRFLSPSEAWEDTLRNLTIPVFLKKGVYRIDFDIVIPLGSFLEIEAGAQLLFNVDCGIIANGSLRACGSSKNEPVIFTSFSGGEGKRWKNISFVGQGASESILRYCEVSLGTGRLGQEVGLYSDAKYGGGLLIRDCSPNIEFCRITMNQLRHFHESFSLPCYGGGIYFRNSNSFLRGNIIDKNEAAGTGHGSGGGIQVTSSDLTLLDNEINDNDAGWCGGGVCLYQSKATICCNKIQRNRCSIGAGIYVTNEQPKQEGDPSVVIKHNLVAENLGNRFCNGRSAGIFLHETNVLLEENIVENNSNRGHTGGGIGVNYSYATIIKNTIRGNNCILGSAIGFGGGGIAWRSSNGIMDGNTIEHNQCQGANGVVAGHGGGIFILSSKVRMNANSIRSNKASQGGGVSIILSTLSKEEQEVNLRLYTHWTNNTIEDNCGGGIEYDGYSYGPTLEKLNFPRETWELEEIKKIEIPRSGLLSLFFGMLKSGQDGKPPKLMNVVDPHGNMIRNNDGRV